MANEPPCAEPHAGWCGEGWRETSPYPIIFFSEKHCILMLFFYVFTICKFMQNAGNKCLIKNSLNQSQLLKL
jgi:hypothetical protein